MQGWGLGKGMKGWLMSLFKYVLILILNMSGAKRMFPQDRFLVVFFFFFWWIQGIGGGENTDILPSHITSTSSFLHYLLQWFQNQGCQYKGLKQGRFLSKKMVTFMSEFLRILRRYTFIQSSKIRVNSECSYTAY